MVSPLLVIGGLVTGAAVVTAVRKKAKAQEIPPGIAARVAKGTPQDLVASAVALAQQKINEGMPPGEAAKVASDAVANLATSLTSQKGA